MASQTEEIEKECNLNTYQFSGKIFDDVMNFYVLKLKDSFFLWIGKGQSFQNLSMAMMTEYDSSATGTIIMGDKSDSTSCTLAQKLAKRTKKQVFVSFNVSSADSMTLSAIEERIIEEMTVNPDKF